MATPAQPSLDRSIRRWDLVAVTINAVIGAGIFGIPSKAFALAGAYSLLAFLICAVAAALIVLCFVEVSSRYTGTGGPYLYAREAYGAVLGFEVGWLTWLARVSAFAANSNLMVQYLGYFFPAAAAGTGRVLLLCATIIPLIVLNVIGIRDVTGAGNVFAVGKLLPLAFFIVTGLFFLTPSRFDFHVTPGFSSFTTLLLLLLYVFSGFEMTVIPGGEMRNPRRDGPIALLIGMAAIMTIYILIQTVCIGTLPTLAQSQRPLAEAASGFLGPWGAVLITVGIMISLAGNLNTLLLAASRVLYAMAERHDLPALFALIHPRFRTPLWSVIATGGIMLVLTLGGTFISQLTISALARLMVYVATCGSLLVLRRRAAAPAAEFRIPAGNGIAIAALAMGAWMLSGIGWRDARDTLLACGAGLLLFLLAKVTRHRAVGA